MGTGLNCTRLLKCTRGQNCTKILLHKGSLLREDFCTSTQFCPGFIIIYFFYHHCYPLPSVRSFFFINIFLFYYHYYPFPSVSNFFFQFIFLYSFTHVQKCNSCKIDPWCEIVFVQFCALMQIWLRAIYSPRAI